jgi:hypothetical protein
MEPGAMSLSDILRLNAGDVALLIGNGIHRYGSAGVNSWDRLLIDLAHLHGLAMKRLPRGATPTEIFDVIDLKAEARSGDLAAAFCEQMRTWQPREHHRQIMNWAVRHDVPVLTTNFDEVLSDAVHAKLMRPNVSGFTYWYPWDSRFAHELHDDPCSGFGVWHINGLARYKRSVRLGLTHYIGSAQRAREWLHRGGNRLFETKDHRNWPGRRTWLHVVFNKPLLILGLGLREDEVFLRWLLIERERYFAKFPSRRRAAWYVFTHDPKDETEIGRKFFLEGIGIECIAVNSYAAIYDIPLWLS